MMKRITTYQRRRLIRGSRAAVTIVMLSVFVVTMHALGLPTIAAIAAGGSLAGIVSTTIERRLLPKPPPWSDEERVQLPGLRPVWLPLGVMAVALFYFIAHIPLAIAVPVVVVSISAFVISELRLRREAERRLRCQGHGGHAA